MDRRIVLAAVVVAAATVITGCDPVKAETRTECGIVTREDGKKGMECTPKKIGDDYVLIPVNCVAEKDNVLCDMKKIPLK